MITKKCHLNQGIWLNVKLVENEEETIELK